MAKYISNKELTNEIIKCKSSNIVSDKLTRMLMLFVEQYSMKASWRAYSYRDEMVANALCHLVLTSEKAKTDIPPVLRFDPSYAERAAQKEFEKSGKVLAVQQNGFAYLTQIVKNSFIRTLKLEHRQMDIRDELIIAHGALPSFNRQQRDHDEQMEDDYTAAKPVQKPEPRKRGRPKVAK